MSPVRRLPQRLKPVLSLKDRLARLEVVPFPVLVAVKGPTSRAQNAREMGHPAVSMPGAGPAYSGTKRDAPPVAVSRVGCDELALYVHSSQISR